MSAGRRAPWLALALKRGIDVTASVVLLVALAPLIVMIAIGVAATTGRPVLFHQARPGRGGEVFTLHKFRTMTDARDERGALAPDGDRLTRFGRWLRSTSLDELPELWNVVRGQMSLVGPRPLLVDYLGRYSPTQARRHEMRPGITGWSQVAYRNAASWEERLAADVWYVDHWSLRLDARILWRTIRVVVRRVGVTQPGHVTAERFRGTVEG